MKPSYIVKPYRSNQMTLAEKEREGKGFRKAGGAFQSEEMEQRPRQGVGRDDRIDERNLN
jgi:hypothetical protein